MEVKTIPHRELRNNSSAILARVAAGESILVTNHGDAAALMVPPTATALDRLRLTGRVRPARRASPGFTQIHRTRDVSSAEVLADLRRHDR
jgi:prevent-host-death family protein